MARGHAGLPRAVPLGLSKAELLETLGLIDQDAQARQRVLDIETLFRTKIGNHVASLPVAESVFAKFSTSPFVLMMYSKRNNYSRISQIEGDILPAKLFSSMETSAGRMIEEILLPVFGWQSVWVTPRRSSKPGDRNTTTNDPRNLLEDSPPPLMPDNSPRQTRYDQQQDSNPNRYSKRGDVGPLWKRTASIR